MVPAYTHSHMVMSVYSRFWRVSGRNNNETLNIIFKAKSSTAFRKDLLQQLQDLTILLFFNLAYMKMPLTWIHTKPTLKNSTVFKATFATTSLKGDSNLFTHFFSKAIAVS